MKHVSKIDGQVYEISKSVSMESGTQYDDDITIIWYDKPYDDNVAYEEDVDARIFIDWYWGEYDADVTDAYIENYWRDD